MLLISLLLTICFAQIQVQLSGSYLETVDNVQRVKEEISKHFSDKFYCFQDVAGMYDEWQQAIYGNTGNGWFCCGYMANGRKQCDRMNAWRMVNGNSFTLCEESYHEAIAQGQNKPRRDLCCSNDHFQDCTSCKSFVVWDFTVEAETYKNNGGDPDLATYGGDRVLEASYNCNKNSEEDIPDASECEDIKNDAGQTIVEIDGKVTLDNEWREVFYNQPAKTVDDNEDITYPPYAYGNEVYPAGFAQGTLREFNDPPVCVYAPNVGGRVLEIRVEPEEAGSQLCVDDLLADTAEKNNPGVTQACDDVRLQTCFPDANSDGDSGGFAFVISCSESCADGDVDLWFRLRASVNKWTEAGDADKGTDKTEVNTEMWCMWGNQNMIGELPEDVDSFKGLDGEFSRWDVFPSDLEPEQDPQVRPVDSGVSSLTLALLVSALALLF